MENFVAFGEGEGCLLVHLSFGVKKKKKKNTKKIRQLSGTHISETTRAIFSNLVCKVLYMVGLKYVNLIEIALIVL